MPAPPWPAAACCCSSTPTTSSRPGFRDAIVLPLAEGRGWGAWQGLVTSDNGESVNSAGGVVHFTGVAWAGGAGRPLGEAPAGPMEVGFPSGACLAIPRERWELTGGFSEPYFLYHEDTDLGLRLRLAGLTVGIEPRAVSDHDYEFDKGAAKWRYLERNRWATVLRTYPTRLLVLLLPALLATELGLLAIAATGGWLGRSSGRTSMSPRPAAPASRAPRDPGDGDDRCPRLHRRADPRPRQRVPGPRRRLEAPRQAPRRLLAPRAPAACRSRRLRTR